jgi:putative DNA primase/helicase
VAELLTAKASPADERAQPIERLAELVVADIAQGHHTDSSVLEELTEKVELAEVLAGAGDYNDDPDGLKRVLRAASVGRQALDRVAGAFARDDIGNAERLVSRHGQDLRYVPGVGWLVWADGRWRPQPLAVVAKAKDTVRHMAAQAALLCDSGVGKAVTNHARASASRSRLEAMVELAKSEPGIHLDADRLDADPWLLACPNGTVDLRTGELREHRRGDLITRLAGALYDPDAHDPRWDRFLEQATGGDTELAAFLQRAAGYSATGDTSEEKLLLVHGPGATGKTTYGEAIRGALGEHATTADFETFLARPGTGGPRSGLAQLRGARFVVSSEVDDGRRLAQGLVKTITGGDTVRASFLYKDSFEYVPRFKLWLLANHAPAVDDQDDAMWRRILRVPFTNVVPAGERDLGLKQHLRKANPAVLAWIVQGALDWQRHGLAPPAAVTHATDAYRDQQDPIADFLDERCRLHPDAEATSADLWAAYQDWAAVTRVTRPLSQKALGGRLEAHDCTPGRRRIDGHAARIWHGIELTGRDA